VSFNHLSPPLLFDFGYREVIRALWRASAAVFFKTVPTKPVALPGVFAPVSYSHISPS
jgi:hypothetical protein